MPRPFIDDAARTGQRGAAIAGEILPGIDAFLRHRDQLRAAGNDRFGGFTAQSPAARLLFREFIDDDQADIVRASMYSCGHSVKRALPCRQLQPARNSNACWPTTCRMATSRPRRWASAAPRARWN